MYQYKVDAALLLLGRARLPRHGEQECSQILLIRIRIRICIMVDGMY
jgi:hypothetical protein